MAEFDWGKAYMRGLQQGAPGGTGYVPGVNPEGVMYANDLIASGKNIGSGQGEFLDYLNILLAPTALAGYGAFRGAPIAARAADKAITTSIVSNALKNPRMAIGMTPAGVEGAIKSGKIKNFSELAEEGVNVQRAPGYLNDRLRIEEEVLGVPRNAPGSQRPAYGAVTSKNYLPYFVANKLPGATGNAVRMLDPRFNRSLDSYAYALISNASDVASQALARTKPGVKGTYTIGDTFQGPNRVFQVGNPQDQAEATDEIVKMLVANTSGRSNNPLVRSSQTFPYLELQASPTTNPFNYIEKFDVPITTQKGNPFGVSPETATARSTAIKNLLNSQGQSGVRTGTLQAVEPAYVNEARRAALKFRNTPPVRAVRDTAYQISQIPSNIRRKITKPQQSNSGLLTGVDWDQVL